MSKTPKYPQNHKQHPPKADRNRQKTTPPLPKNRPKTAQPNYANSTASDRLIIKGDNNNAFWWGRRGTEGIIFLFGSVILWESQGGEVEKLQGGGVSFLRRKRTQWEELCCFFYGWNSGPQQEAYFFLGKFLLLRAAAFIIFLGCHAFLRL